MVLQAIRYTSGTNPFLEILDQLALPHRTTYLQISSCKEAHSAIKQMKVRGAPAIAIVAALALAVELGNAGSIPLDCTETERLIGGKLDYLRTSRPTAVNLENAVGKLKAIVMKRAARKKVKSDDLVKAYIEGAQRMLVDDVHDNEAIGKYGASWIQEHTIAGKRKRDTKTGELKILTHCNTGSLATAGYGTALGVIRSLHASKILTHAYCSETRPYNQGSRLTAYELVHDQISATLVTDSMAAALLAREGECIAAIVVGADRVAANGDTANKIGTYSLAVLARYHGVKFLVAAPKTTIDLSTKSGRDIEIEERAAEEVTCVHGFEVNPEGHQISDKHPITISMAAEGIGVWNPAFDVTPAELIDGIVTEVGVVERGADGSFNFQSVFGTDISDDA